MRDNMYALIAVAVMAGISFLLRAVPFFVFGGKRTVPKFIVYLGKTLPFAVMGMLLVYCFKDVTVFSAPHGLPELIAGLVTAGLYIRRRNTLLSIFVGTVSYMLLVQLVF